MVEAGKACACGALPHSTRAGTRIKCILNWKYEGPQRYFCLAQDRGFFRDEGIHVAFDQGSGCGAPSRSLSTAPATPAWWPSAPINTSDFLPPLAERPLKLV